MHRVQIAITVVLVAWYVVLVVRRQVHVCTEFKSALRWCWYVLLVVRTVRGTLYILLVVRGMLYILLVVRGICC